MRLVFKPLPAVLLLMMLVSTSFVPKRESNNGTQENLKLFRRNSDLLAKSVRDLGFALKATTSQKPATVTAAKKALVNSRGAYKRLEYFLEYFFPSSVKIYNRAPKTEVEEPFMGYEEPAGFQLIETMLFDSLPETHRQDFEEQILLLSLSARNLNALLYGFAGTDVQMLQANELQLIRVMTLGITGFDAPQLKSGIAESFVAMDMMEQSLSSCLPTHVAVSDRIQRHISRTTAYLRAHPDFDSFDRLTFLKQYALPLQRFLRQLIASKLPDKNKARDTAPDLFAQTFFDHEPFRTPASRAKIKLGKKLFGELRLSGNHSRSCASCHKPELYFGDGLPKNFSLDGKSTIRRHTPSLLYAGLQYKFFWDGRAQTLDEQAISVMHDSLEMNAGPGVAQRIGAVRAYRKAFRKAFDKRHKDEILEKDIAEALTAYIRTLRPFNARFDEYMSGNSQAMTPDEKAGFNLFMGKAQCGTCHFAPVFNGLIPPLYQLTEFEVLGTTTDAKFSQVDDDEGKAGFLWSPHFSKAFKTPTVRNAEKTAPYMHNGSLNTLDEVIEFYDQGGGAGLGHAVPNQTLSSAKLNLNNKEKADLIAFLKTLTDQHIPN